MSADRGSSPNAANDDSHLWLPPRRLRRYKHYQIITGFFLCAIFAGWTMVMWQLTMMRWLSIILIVTTAWVVVTSIARDATRGRGRQLMVRPDRLVVTTPEGTHTIWLDQIALARWQDQPSRGLCLLDHRHQVLAHLDRTLLADEAEAQAFLGWARRRAELMFEVQWC